MTSDPIHSKTRSRPVRDGLQFFGAFLKSPGSVGAVLPSSRFLSNALVGSLDLDPGELVVEFGPGTGPVTALIRKRLPRGARYLGIEMEPRFCAMLQQRFDGMSFHQGSAADLEQILRDRDLPWPRRIVSGIPFASLSATVQDGIIEGAATCLAVDGEFRTFQYVHAYGLPAARRFRAAMLERFKVFNRSKPVVRNVPPAFVLSYSEAH